MSARNMTPAFAVGGVSDLEQKWALAGVSVCLSLKVDPPDDYLGIDSKGVTMGFIGGGNPVRFIETIIRRWKERDPDCDVIRVPCGDGENRFYADHPHMKYRHFKTRRAP